MSKAATMSEADAVAARLQPLIQLSVPQLDENRGLTTADEPRCGLSMHRWAARGRSRRGLARRRLVQAGRPADALALSEALDKLRALRGGGHGLRNLPAALQLLSLMHSSRAATAACAGAALLSRAAAPAALPMPPAQPSHVAPPGPDVEPPAERPATAPPAATKAPATASPRVARTRLRNVRLCATCSSCCRTSTARC